jgi:hypothetical protein
MPETLFLLTWYRTIFPIGENQGISIFRWERRCGGISVALAGKSALTPDFRQRFLDGSF